MNLSEFGSDLFNIRGNLTYSGKCYLILFNFTSFSSSHVWYHALSTYFSKKKLKAIFEVSRVTQLVDQYEINDARLLCK